MNEESLPILDPHTGDRIYAGFWRRSGALFLDVLFLLPLTIGSLLIDNHGRLNYFYTTIPIYIFCFFYFVYPVQRWGGTPGKLVSRILILKPNGGKVGWKEAIIRHLPVFLLGIIGIVAKCMALQSMDDHQFLSISFSERARWTAILMPSWAKYGVWGNRLWVILGIIIMMSNDRRRAVHDFFAGTVVVKKKYRPMLNQSTHSITASDSSE